MGLCIAFLWSLLGSMPFGTGNVGSGSYRSAAHGSAGQFAFDVHLPEPAGSLTNSVV